MSEYSRGAFSGSPSRRGGGRGRGFSNSYNSPPMVNNNYYQQTYPDSYGAPPAPVGYAYGGQMPMPLAQYPPYPPMYPPPGVYPPGQYQFANQGPPQQYYASSYGSPPSATVQRRHSNSNREQQYSYDENYPRLPENSQPQPKPQSDVPQQSEPSPRNNNFSVEEKQRSILKKRDSSGSDEAFDDRAYVQSIINAYHMTEESSQILVQASLPYAKVTLAPTDGASEDLNLHSSEVPCKFQWRFQVYVTHPSVLKFVSFLCDDRSAKKAFEMVDFRGNRLEGCTVSAGDCFKKHAGIYEVRVDFHCSRKGIYKQWVAFDLTGQAPYIVRQLHVFVGDENDPAFQVEKFRFDTTVAELDWNSATVDIVISDWPSYDREAVARQLLARWKPLGAALENDSLALRTKGWGPDNYKRVMHGLIRLEEAAVAGAIGRVFIDAPVMKIQQSPDGLGLEGLIMLGQALDPRTKMGELTLKNASRMLLAFKDFVDFQAADGDDNADRLRRVYEADVIEKRRGILKPGQQQPTGGDLFSTIVRLHLSQRCIDEQNLKAGSSVLLHQARFQISRLPFSEWHDAVEKVFCWNVLFPSIELQHVPRLDLEGVQLTHGIVDEGLFHNPSQMAVVRAILAKPVGNGNLAIPTLPPVIIQGAFGTGKTFTLAQALKMLLEKASKHPEIRMILCTNSNSAADLYITQYLLPFLVSLHQQGRSKTQLPRVLRIYKTQRKVPDVDPNVLKFCRLQPSQTRPGQYEFAPATTGDISSTQLIISNLVGVMDLERLCLPKSTFSHIFLDEAAQSFEPDALKALCLAGPQTRVVMAGDPRQMAGGTIHCQLLKRYGFDRALIERIAQYYGAEFQTFGELGYGHVLQTNYRCHPKIMAFIGKHFYPDLANMKNEYQCGFTDYFPFRFYNTDTNSGFEQFHQPSSSYFNYVEAVEVQNRVVELLTNWNPAFTENDALGQPKPKESEIAIIAASDAQVMLLQQKMREVPETQTIPVSHISWIQGLEFRAIFISTVRTLKVSQDDEAEVDNYDLTFLSDKRLLNTAITRAKSVVFIVGSERTLTSVGQCREIWRSLIESCRANSTFFSAIPMARDGMPAEANREAAKQLLQARFENVSVVPDYADQRLMVMSNRRGAEINERRQAGVAGAQPPGPPPSARGVPISEHENSEMAHRYQKFSQIVEKIFANQTPPGVPIPWSNVTSSRMVWLKVIGAPEYFSGTRHPSNLLNRDEADVAAILIRGLIAKSTGEILVVCGTVAQAALLKKKLSSLPQTRMTVIDICHPLPRQNFSHLVMTLVKANVKSERALQQERVSADRTGRAKAVLSTELIDTELLAKIIEMGSPGGVAFIGNHLNASVFPAWDWLYRRIAYEGGAFDNLQELGL